MKWRFQAATIALATLWCITACATDARLKARPTKPSAACVPGLHGLGLGSERDGQFFIPATAANGKRLPLIVFLHGATQGSWLGIKALQEFAEKQGFLLLVPESRAMTWDAIRGDFGPDIDFLNRALAQVFQQCPVDPGKIALAGFSDGASYALSIGLANGDLFSRIIAFSPGFIVPAGASGKPLIFVSHGTRDRILPIEQTSRTLVSSLEAAGYHVTYREFDGPHAMPPDIVAQAVKWAR